MLKSLWWWLVGLVAGGVLAIEVVAGGLVAGWVVAGGVVFK